MQCNRVTVSPLSLGVSILYQKGTSKHEGVMKMRFMESTVKKLTARYERRGEEILEMYTAQRVPSSVPWDAYLIRKLK